MNSYISVINKIKDFYDKHAQVKRFGADFLEQMSNFSTLNNDFPIVFVAPVDKQLNEFSHTYTIDVYCWDLIEEDRINVNTCLSDTDMILTDLWIELSKGEDYSISVGNTNPNITPLNNGLLDYAVGNVMRLEVTIDTWCYTEIPYKPTGETFNIIDENNNPLVTENGDNLVWI